MYADQLKCMFQIKIPAKTKDCVLRYAVTRTCLCNQNIYCRNIQLYVNVRLTPAI